MRSCRGRSFGTFPDWPEREQGTTLEWARRASRRSPFGLGACRLKPRLFSTSNAGRTSSWHERVARPGSPRGRARRGAWWVLFSWIVAVTVAMGASAAPGKYTARREARGDVTDTAPRLDAWAFFDDSKPTPLGLTVLVDTFAARTALDTGLLPLVVGLGYEDTGPKLPVRPWTFELSWDGGATRGLSFEELRGVEGWQSALNRHRRLLAKRPRPYDGSTATLIDVSFYPDPPMSTWRSEDAKLS